MLDPNSDFFRRVTDLIRSGDLTGPNRPVGRVTFIDGFNNRYFSDTRPGIFRSNLFGQGEWIGPDGETRGGGPPDEATELQVSSITINRGLDQDAATCTISMPNVRPGAYAPQGDDDDPFGFGYLSSLRGVQTSPAPSVYGEKTDWNYGRNATSKLLRTNFLVRTYQGYGSDNFDAYGNHRNPDDPQYVHPHDDTKLTLTGVWLIDKVTRTANPGQIPMITLECRDLAKLLITQVIYPTLVPKKRFPLVYKPKKKDEVGDDVTKVGGALGLSRAGHGPDKAFDGRSETWWQNQALSNRTDKTWLEAVCDGNKINHVKINLKDTPVDVYISVKENGEWQGSNNIPGGGIKYVKHRSGLPIDGQQEIELPRVYEADVIRLTFTQLGTVDGIKFCVGVQGFQAFHVKTDDTVCFGAIEDWSEAIKELCAWAGFTWWDAPKADPLCGRDVATGNKMAVWGDFEVMGAGPVEDTPADYFVSKSFMEGVRQIVDFLGAIFYVDHTGGVQYRMPNVWTGGSFIVDPNSATRKARIEHHPIEFHENVNLMSFSVVEDDAVMRHEILVVGGLDESGSNPTSGGISLIAPDMPVSFRGLLNGQKRLMQVPGDATKLFKKVEECQRMAELIGVKMLFAYRRAQSTIVAHPGLHLDDQVRIFERTSSEAYVHYVTGIDSDMDLQAGSWTMNVTSNWLGTDPDTDWFVDTRQLTNSVLNLPGVFKAMGKAPK